MVNDGSPGLPSASASRAAGTRSWPLRPRYLAVGCEAGDDSHEVENGEHGEHADE